MRHQAIKKTALMLGILVLAAGPAQAGPVGYSDIISLASVNGASGLRTSVDLRLRALSQQTGKASAQTPAAPTTAQDGKAAGANSPGGASGGGSASGSLTGTEVAPQQTGTTVETIQVGEVDGTICDCGEIAPLPGGFPLWPLLGLGAVPLLFLPDDNPIIDLPPPTPTNPIPEPATLLLFGTGLLAAGAGARRRRAAQKSALAAREV